MKRLQVIASLMLAICSYRSSTNRYNFRSNVYNNSPDYASCAFNKVFPILCFTLCNFDLVP
jgi:hypothetical protein